jgi:hypothetical protein
MIFICLTILCTYLILRSAYSELLKRGREAGTLKLRIIDLTVITAVVVFLSVYYLNNDDIFSNYIVSKLLIYLALIMTVLSLGIGGTVDLLTRTEALRENQKYNLVRDFGNIISNLSIAFLFFIVCVLEASKANIYTELAHRKLFIFIFSTIAALICGYHSYKQQRLIRIGYGIIIGILGVVLFMLKIESSSDLILTTAFIFFSAAYIASNGAGFLVNHLLKKRHVELPSSELNVQEALEEIAESENQNRNYDIKEETTVNKHTDVSFLKAEEPKKKTSPKKSSLLKKEEPEGISLEALRK